MCEKEQGTARQIYESGSKRDHLLSCVEVFPIRLRRSNWRRFLNEFKEYTDIVTNITFDTDNSIYVIVALLDKVHRVKSYNRETANSFLEQFSEHTILKDKTKGKLKNDIKSVAKSTILDEEVKRKGISWMISRLDDPLNSRERKNGISFISQILGSILNQKEREEGLDLKEKALIVRSFWEDREMVKGGDFGVIRGLFTNTVKACYSEYVPSLEDNLTVREDLFTGLETAHGYLSKSPLKEIKNFALDMRPEIYRIGRELEQGMNKLKGEGVQ